MYRSFKPRLNIARESKMAMTVYGMPVSAPCRLIHMVCEVLEKQYESRMVNIMQGDQHLLWFTRVISSEKLISS